MIKKIIRKIFSTISKWILNKYNPNIVVITGSAGKTSTKEAIFTVLSKFFPTRKTERNLNTEYGVALTIIGIFINEPKITPWVVLKSIIYGIKQIVFTNPDYPKVLVLELGADRPGDIKYFMKWIKPKISVISAIGEIPAHVEYYSGPEEVAKEKSWVVKALDKDGVAVLNNDDLVVLDMKSATKAKTITFGFGEDSDVRIVEYKIFEEGINFKLFSNGSFVPVILNNCFGKPYAYAAAAAACVGISLGLNLVEISEALLSYQGSPGRMRLLSGIKNTRILDDTYNASPISMHAALETLESIPAKRKIAILGDMREIGKYNYETHEAIGYLAASVSDIIVAVGDSAKIILEGAKNKGFPSEKLFHFYSSEEAGPKVQEIIKEGDLILVKGARAMRMEKIVEEIMAEPQRAKELLVH